MEQRNLDFEVEMTEDQWAEVGQRAEALGPDSGGFTWDEDRFDEIHLFLRPFDAPPLWRDWVSNEGVYGTHRREVAQFRFNDGRPFASIHLPDDIREPVFSDEEETAMRIELEHWVRDRWHALLRESGLHYERGHIPQG